MRGIPLSLEEPDPLPRALFAEFLVDRRLLFASPKPLLTRVIVAGGANRVSNSIVLAVVNGNLPIFLV